MSGRKANKELTLAVKVALLKEVENGVSQRVLSEKYDVSRKQIYNLLRKKDEIFEAERSNTNKDRKRLHSTIVISQIDNVMWRWFQLARQANIPISGPILQEKAMHYATELKINDFKASNGWLQRFKDRHNICGGTLSGEAAAVDRTSVESWISRVPELVQGYSPRDIFNIDETGLIYRALPDKSLKIRGEDCKGGKRSKERLTVVLCCNQLGEFEKPLVIGKAQSPRCFKGVAVLPVSWRWNKKAWMTSSIFQEWLSSFNDRLRRADRHVLLFLDNAPSHQRDSFFSNIKLLFLPANTTALLQPLDQGIIQAFKANYRKALLRHILCAIDLQTCADGLAKSVSVLKACYWIKDAFNGIKPSTVGRCFSRCGFPNTVQTTAEELDELPLAEIIRALSLPEGTTMTAEEFMDIDNGAPANEELPVDWEVAVLQEVAPEEESETDEEEDSQPAAATPTGSTWASCRESMSTVMSYVESQANLPPHIIQMASSLQAEIEKHVAKTVILKQTTLDSFMG